ncbi:unnamed protein product [Moneuplotes crassus]|uniref:Uncharacterized protein n=1 Tax=Euplotes crassus TaxID=5936 RepID=A0AAD2CZR6_EUPCR|nr:unnamed protein product [Moneuplotes crassus]
MDPDLEEYQCYVICEASPFCKNANPDCYWQNHYDNLAKQADDFCYDSSPSDSENPNYYNLSPYNIHNSSDSSSLNHIPSGTPTKPKGLVESLENELLGLEQRLEKEEKVSVKGLFCKFWRCIRGKKGLLRG